MLHWNTGKVDTAAFTAAWALFLKLSEEQKERKIKSTNQPELQIKMSATSKFLEIMNSYLCMVIIQGFCAFVINSSQHFSYKANILISSAHLEMLYFPRLRSFLGHTTMPSSQFTFICPFQG